MCLPPFVQHKSLQEVKRTVPVVSSFTVYDRFPSIETTAPHDRRVFLSWSFFINMTVWCSPLFGGSLLFSPSFVLLEGLRCCCLCCRTGWVVLKVDLIWPSCETSVHRVKGYWHLVVCRGCSEACLPLAFLLTWTSQLIYWASHSAFSQWPFFLWKWRVPALFMMLNCKQSSWKPLEVYCEPRSRTTFVR